MRTLSLAALLLISAASQADADAIKLTAALAAVDTSSTAAQGSCDFSFDTDTNQLTYFIRYQNLTGDVTSADVRGPASQAGSGPVIFHFEAPDSPIEGTKTFSTAQASELLGGQLYVELDTKAHPSGEVHGQIHRK